jgi:hypothetical protein
LRKLKIYLAGSWRLAPTIRHYGRYLRGYPEFDVDVFCDRESGRVGFDLVDEFAKRGLDPVQVDPISALKHPVVGPLFEEAFSEDVSKLHWCDCVVMMQPCGNSSHMEGGYAKGLGKLLYMYWTDFPTPGTFDNMYQFADDLFYPNELGDLLITLRELQKSLQAKHLTERWVGC